MIIDAVTMKLKAEGRPSKQWITDVKFSPDSKTIAVSSADENLYIHDNLNSKHYPQKATIDKHSDIVIGMDYSSDSCIIRSSSADGKQFFRE